ncbi:MAG: tetratricopeptide repeat protein, partial [Candidatus Eisenbacteria bacterium]|nr:tetratricopeptide repeat protein [Candidatus Eisenbacteria bacterium]
QQRCGDAVRFGVRPGTFLRNRAALALAAGEGGVETGMGIARDLQGAFLFGGHRPLLWILCGDWLLQRGDPVGAAACYRKATGWPQTAADAWNGLGEALFAQDALRSAQEAFERALALRPQDPWILNNAGVVLRARGDLALAADRFAAAHRAAPELFEPRFNLGLTHEQAGRMARARYWYTRAAELRPDFPPVRDRLRALGDQ